MGNAFQIAEQRGAAWAHRQIVQDPPLAADVGFDEWVDLSEAFFHKSSAAADAFAEMLRAEGVTDASEDLAEAFLEGATNAFQSQFTDEQLRARPGR